MTMLLIEYADGEAKVETFDTLKECLEYLNKSFIETEDYAKKITIEIY